MLPHAEGPIGGAHGVGCVGGGDDVGRPGGVVGVVLAAGAGRRMGGPKALVRSVADGPALVESAIAAVREGGCPEVICVVGAAAERVVPLALAAGARVVVAQDWAEGMGASVRAALAALAESRAAALLLTLVDLPDVTPAVIARVLGVVDVQQGKSPLTDPVRPTAVLARAAYRGRPGHPVLIGRDHWVAVRTAARADEGARSILRGPGVRLVECGDLATGRDVDRPEDLGRRGGMAGPDGIPGLDGIPGGGGAR